MTNGEKIKVILKPRTDQIRIYGDWVEIEIQSLGINFSCELSWWNSEYKESTIEHIQKMPWYLEPFKQAIKTLEQESTTKNDLVVDCISRKELIDWINAWGITPIIKKPLIRHIRAMSSVTPQEPQTFKWCTDCKEYDQEKHCCHRWSKVIRDTVEEMKQKQEPILDKIFCMVHPLSIMSTPELEHKAIMQIAEMLEPLCLPESEPQESEEV